MFDTMHMIAELEILNEKIQELRGLLEDEQAANLFLSDLVKAYAMAEGTISARGFTHEQIDFLIDQFPDAPRCSGVL